MSNYLYIGGCRILLALIIFVNSYTAFKVSLGLLQLIIAFIQRTYIFNVNGEIYFMVDVGTHILAQWPDDDLYCRSKLVAR